MDILEIQPHCTSSNIDIVLCQFFAEFHVTPSCLLHEFFHGLFTENGVLGWVVLNLFWSHKFLSLFCDSLHVLLVLTSLVVGDVVDSGINGLFDFLLRPSATPWSIRVRVPGLQITLGFRRHAYSIGSRMNQWWSQCYFLSFSKCELSREQLSFHTFADNLYDLFAKILDQHLVLWTNESSTLHLVQVSNEFDTFLGFVASVIDSASSASLLNGKRSEEDCLSSFFTFHSSCH